MSEVGQNDRRYESPLNYLETSSQNTKIIKRNLPNQFSPIPPKMPKVRSLPENEVMEQVSEKKDHKLLLKQKNKFRIWLILKVPESPFTKFQKPSILKITRPA